jgi:deoxyribodipyrimidine photo-lyase
MSGEDRVRDLPLPPIGPDAATAWVRDHLAHLCREGPTAIAPSPTHRGTQAAADTAMASFDVAGYAARRNEVLPAGRRGASALSPWIRHGLLPLPRVWASVSGPARDVEKFRDELLWQEYARHFYARIGTGTSEPLRAAPPPTVEPTTESKAADEITRLASSPMACMRYVAGSLANDGWLVNQTRMWFASHWSVREGRDWRVGEDLFFAHLLDGSRAANRIGWQWTIGTGTGRTYGFSRFQVRKRAPELCTTCALRSTCPVEDWPAEREVSWIDAPATLRRDTDVERTAGPRSVSSSPMTASPIAPTVVWLTAESLGDDDPALGAHRDLPVVFVFDEPLLATLQLSGKRLVFLVERLGELAAQRSMRILLGRPQAWLQEIASTETVATTFAPVPGWARTTRNGALVHEVHPWPWLRRPHNGPVSSFSAWRSATETGARPQRRSMGR